jgi:hypothetical protein
MMHLNLYGSTPFSENPGPLSKMVIEAVTSIAKGFPEGQGSFSDLLSLYFGKTKGRHFFLRRNGPE